MSKRSGFAITLKAFFPAVATDGDAMVKALNKISNLLIEVADGGIVEDVQQRFMLSREVPEEVKAEDNLPVFGPDGKPMALQLNPQEPLPPIPAALRRP